MTISRSQQIDLETTQLYHCINRCVRRAFLCGEDLLTGQSYEHRRGWIADKLTELSDVFAIDVVSYAVMSNHYHVILHVDKDTAESWSAQEVINRWKQFFKLPTIISDFTKDQLQTDHEKDIVSEIVDEWRSRLYNISWYMRILNEHIAREANKEDKVKGCFWEGRFKSQALLDEQALLTCMAYVDLNPIRAGIAETPEESEYTSIEERIKQALNHESSKLLPFQDQVSNHLNQKTVIPFLYSDYLQLIDWSGRAILDNKKGSIPQNMPPILQRLGIQEKKWIQYIQDFEQQFPTAAGNSTRLEKLAKRTKRNWIKGIKNAFTPLLS